MYLYQYTYIYMYVCICINMYIYIYIYGGGGGGGGGADALPDIRRGGRQRRSQDRCSLPLSIYVYKYLCVYIYI